jgi:hypothetical protein
VGEEVEVVVEMSAGELGCFQEEEANYSMIFLAYISIRESGNQSKIKQT